MLTQLLLSHKTIMNALKLLKKSGDDMDDLLRDHALDIKLLHSISC